MPHRKRPRFVSLRLELLEPREAPAASLGLTENFDTTPTGTLPAGWSQWSSGAAAFAVSSSLALSAPHALTAASPTASGLSARAFPDAPQPADVQVSADVYLNSFVPAQVIARGTGLGTGTPTYYAATVTDGLIVRLTRVVNGVSAPLGEMKAADWLTHHWVRLTLSVNGGNLQVQVSRPDTGQYLDSSGRWQSGQAWALTQTDTAITAGGQVGLGRPASYAGSITFDDFASAPAGNANPPLPVPNIPRHYSHIRILELAYQGAVPPYDDQLLRNSVDVVIPEIMYQQAIASVAPNTPQLLYTNVSSIYQGLLTDWLTYADAHGLSREAAFYHVSKATPFVGAGGSSQPVDWFWGVYRGGKYLTNQTYQAHAGVPAGVAFANPGESLDVGYTERFREINLNLLSGAGAGWSAALEYPTAVDAAGNPTAWAPLTTLTDTTAGLTRSGQITFDPPADWKAASIGGSARLFYVRFRTLTAGTAPVAKTILGRDYVGANGTNRAVIPAFDAAADTDHDGYLNDAEYARRAAGMDARFDYESRDFTYGPMRFATNPGSLAFQSWAADYAVRFLDSHPLAAGLFVDNSPGRPPVAAGGVLEPTANYANDYAALLYAVGRAVAPRWILANTAGGGLQADPTVRTAQGYFEEFAIRPLAHNYQQFEQMAGEVAGRATLTSPAPYAVLDSYPGGGSPTDPRTQIATLAYYYLLADPQTTFLDFYGGFSPSSPWSQHWSPAAAYDVGQPVGPWSLFATGADPANASLTYRVYQRQYTNALVLYKPLSWGHNVTGTLADATATPFALGGTYSPLRADGTLGAPVTSVTLRNGEGAILIKTH